MPEKIEMQVLGLANSDMQTRTYAVILEEKYGKRRLPIVIGEPEAKSIATVLEKIKPTRPGVHDLFANTLETMEIRLREVVVSNLVEGVFYATLVLEENQEPQLIDARSSDAIALALRLGRPIFTHGFILDEIGVVPEEENAEVSLVSGRKKRGMAALRDYSLTELNNLLEKVLEKEDYESAARIRDEIARKKDVE